MARFQARLDHLFQTVRAPDGGEYTYRHVAAEIERLVGYRASSSYLQELRAGLRINASMKHLHGLCAFFGVPIAYFFDVDLAARVDTQLDVAASLRDPLVRRLAVQATGLSTDTLQAITQIVQHTRRIEGLVELGGGTPGPVHLPRRRGRRARPRVQTSASDAQQPGGAT